MKATYILALCFLAFLLGESVATTASLHKHHHHHDDLPSSQPELLQTQSQTETSTQATAGTATGTETECSPDCILNYPYNAEGCKPHPEPPVVNEESIIPPVIIITEEEGSIVIHTEEWVVTFNEEIPIIPVDEETVIITGGEQPLIIDYEGEGSIPPVIIISEEETTFYIPPDETITTSNEETNPIPTHEEYIIVTGEGGEVVIIPPEPECVYTASLSSGITHAYGQPTTYLTYVVHDSKVDQDVTYTYVLTTMYSGTVQTDTNDYVVYGTGAINFYNTYYGVNDYLTDNPGCNCVCGYSSYTFSYSFDF